MNSDYIELSGQKYRVEVNWNAITAYLAASGRDDITALMNFGSLKPTDLAGLLAAAINEGERLEGRESSLTAERVGEMADFASMGQFISIFASQTSAKGGDTPGKGKKKE